MCAQNIFFFLTPRFLITHKSIESRLRREKVVFAQAGVDSQQENNFLAVSAQLLIIRDSSEKEGFSERK
jgi:hypothetical protein